MLWFFPQTTNNEVTTLPCFLLVVADQILGHLCVCGILRCLLRGARLGVHPVRDLSFAAMLVLMMKFESALLNEVEEC